jgi:hypothetical protein
MEFKVICKYMLTEIFNSEEFISYEKNLLN